MNHSMNTTYEELLESKITRAIDAGFSVDPASLNPLLSPFQAHIVVNALQKGRFAIFADCGLGKTFMQLVWADEVVKYTERPVVYRTAGDGSVYTEGDRTAALTTGTDQNANVVVIPYDLQQATSPVNTQNRKDGDPAPTIGRDNAGNIGILTNGLGVFMAGQGAKAGGIAYSTEVTPTLKAAPSGMNQVPSIHTGLAVRRLTPVECARLQGFPDNYLHIPYKGKPQPADGPMYKAYGNSIAVPVLTWIGKRIQEVNQLEWAQ